jgi:hypothetical protein
MPNAFGLAPTAAAPRDARALEAGLAAEGLAARVRADGPLALLDAEPEPFASAAGRALALRLARAHGFTHVALVLPEPADGHRPGPRVPGAPVDAGAA